MAAVAAAAAVVATVVAAAVKAVAAATVVVAAVVTAVAVTAAVAVVTAAAVVATVVAAAAKAVSAAPTAPARATAAAVAAAAVAAATVVAATAATEPTGCASRTQDKPLRGLFSCPDLLQGFAAIFGGAKRRIALSERARPRPVTAARRPPRRAGGVPLPERRSHPREGAEGRGSKPACAGLDGSEEWPPLVDAPRREATQGVVTRLLGVCAAGQPVPCRIPSWAAGA